MVNDYMRHHGPINVRTLVSSPRLFMILVYVLVSIVYLGYTWGHELASLEGDEFIYLLSAEHFSPWTEPSSVAAYVASNSPSPPLFPLVLGFLGGGDSILAANIIVTMFMLLSFVVFSFWLLEEGVTEWRAFVLAFLFAILPGTYMQALFVMSEGLYLILSMACLLAVAKAENSQNDRWFVAAALCVAAVMLTRSAGWALFAAFAAYLMWHRCQKTWLLLIVAALPATTWSIYKGVTGGTDGPTYFGLLLEWYLANPIWDSANPFSVLLNQTVTEASRLWKGLSSDFTTTPVGASVFGVVGILFMGAVAYRLYLRKLDGIYVAMYIAMILVWPFSYAANAEKRFAIAVIPILMFQALFLIGRLSRNLPQRLRFNPIEVIYLSLILLLALPTLALVAARYFQPVAHDLEPFRRVGWWYSWYWKDSLIPAPVYMKYAKVLSETLPEIRSNVPEHECVYSVKPYIVDFYMRRISKYPPGEVLEDADFLKMLNDSGCRYFFFMNDISPSISKERFYPAHRLGDTVQSIIAVQYTEGENTMIMGVLGKLK